ncbi:HD family phosphohydrolase [Candidatus Dojkabacteria bacterium]|uniref:HD family phosphohydrolase n=1 Tax=Candidatus Dojkabacteria bacterium TaxID=2099670 RepID=A0A955L5Y6_9BACT|nr:HD family phosphohydrolase [Candidatus Dojkabacteria bacterium]
MISNQSYKKLFESVFELYNLPENKSKLLFHGWHHINFVHNMSIKFAESIDARIDMVASAALVHDLNYIFTDKLEPEAANAKIQEYLEMSDFSPEDTSFILGVIEDAHTEYRENRTLSLEAQALSDADTLFKSLPTTPILFASKFLTQNKYDIGKLANKVVAEQKPLMDKGIYFYTDLARSQYSDWAETSLHMWENVLDSLSDPDVAELLDIARQNDII